MIFAIVYESLPTVIVMVLLPIILAFLAGIFGYDLEIGKMKFIKSKNDRNK